MKWFDLQDDVCTSCEVLKQQLESVNEEKQLLLNSILDITKPVVTIPEVHKEIKPVQSSHKLWSVRRAELEKNDRLTAEENKRQAEATAQLEKEVGIDNAS